MLVTRALLVSISWSLMRVSSAHAPGRGGKEAAADGRGGGRPLADTHDGRERARRVHRKELVAKRKECRLCEAHDLTNPGVYKNGAYDMSGHIGPWTQWQGKLDADLRVMVQDWGGVEYFFEHKGLEEDTNTTKRMGYDSH
jgi:hypothetical protein